MSDSVRPAEPEDPRELPPRPQPHILDDTTSTTSLAPSFGAVLVSMVAFVLAAVPWIAVPAGCLAIALGVRAFIGATREWRRVLAVVAVLVGAVAILVSVAVILTS